MMLSLEILSKRQRKLLQPDPRRRELPFQQTPITFSKIGVIWNEPP